MLLPVFCSWPDFFSWSSCVNLWAPTSIQDQLFLTLELQVTSTSHLKENYQARSPSLISCLASCVGLLTTSSLTLCIYFLAGHITQEFSAPSAVLISLTQGLFTLPFHSKVFTHCTHTRTHAHTHMLLLEPCPPTWRYPLLYP